ncbi:MAG TPA: trimeric intracellular cation channel family protein [Verrucomicrobiae bacterium]
MALEINSQFVLPIYFNLGATFLYALTGALVAIRRRYDIIGLFVLAAVSGVGGSLIRDCVFIENGPPLVMKDERYLYAVIAGCFAAAFFGHRMDRLQKCFLLADALGLGAYAVVGVSRSLSVDLPLLPSITVGVINAAGGGLLRDILVREEPLLFKPGQLYVLAALLGAGFFAVLVVRFARPVETSGLLAIGVTFVFRLLAIAFNWKTGSVVKSFGPPESEPNAPTDDKPESAATSPAPPPQKRQPPSEENENEK